MNITNQNHQRQISASGLSRISKPATQAIRLAAWAAMAGSLLCAPAYADDNGASGPVALVEAPSTAPVPATQPAAEAAGAATNPAAPAATPAAAATEPAASLVSKGLSANGTVNLMLNKSVVLTTRVPYARIHIAQPDIADVQLIQPAANQILVTGKKAGSTQLVIWDNQEHSEVIEVVVGFDLRGLDSQMKIMFPKAAITVESANGVIVLRGHVPDLETATKAVAVAEPYSTGGKTPVLNFLEVSGGQQVMLQVRFAEVSRSVTQKLGFNAFATDGKFSLGLGQGTAGSAPTVANGATIGTNNGAAIFPAYGGAAFGNASFEYFISALRSNNLLRTLAEPNLTAISGQPASFLAGGEFPIPIPQASGGGTAITIEYKKFGIQLNFTPTVLGDGRVRLLCTPSVSELDFTNAVQLDGFTIPALTTRNVNTTVELAEGQTFALAGLLQNHIKASNTRTPLLGDLPIIGPLFNSVSYERDETELVVLVTPRLVEALNPSQVPAIPGEVWRDPTEADLFWKGDLGGEAPNMHHAPHVRMSHFYGNPGFNPATAAPQK